MNPLDSEWLASQAWFITRASGVMSMLLFTAVTVLGIMMMKPRLSTRNPDRDVLIARAHGSVTLTAIVFLILHIVTSIADGYVPISWWAVFVPLVSEYQPVVMGLGAVAVDLLIAIVVTALLRNRLPRGVFRAVHWLAYGLWGFSLLHGVFASTSDQSWFWPLSVACFATVVGLATYRALQFRPHQLQQQQFSPAESGIIAGAQSATGPTHPVLVTEHRS